MSNTPPKRPQPTSNWLSNILRPHSSSISVESCLNLAKADPATPLDARPIIPLLLNTQPFAARCKHLKVFSDLCKSYKFSHLENVFFAVQDILQASSPRDGRHVVFKFMLACIRGQYSDLGMARITFYNSLRNHDIWEDYEDMYRVLFELCKGGRDISGFEKNISKLLISWLDTAFTKAALNQSSTVPRSPFSAAPSTSTSLLSSTAPAVVTSADARPTSSSVTSPTPFVSDVLQLLTGIAKFNFPLFEEGEVTNMLKAVHDTFFASSHSDDINACLDFADVVVRYRFVPFDSLEPFLEILCVGCKPSSDSSKTSTVCWSIFGNLMRSHCAHNAILTLCLFLRQSIPQGSREETIAEGAVSLLSETAWGSNLKALDEKCSISELVLLIYFKFGARQKNEALNIAMLKSLRSIVENADSKMIHVDWETFWDICDICAQHVLEKTSDAYKWSLLESSEKKQLGLDRALSQILNAVYTSYTSGTYHGPVSRFMTVLYTLRRCIPEEATFIMLAYFEKEHMFMPSSKDWIDTLLEITHTYMIATPGSVNVRRRVLTIIANVWSAVRELRAEDMLDRVILPIVSSTAQETNADIRREAIDLIIDALFVCDDEDTFDRLLRILQDCSRCDCFIKSRGIDAVKVTKPDRRSNQGSPSSQRPTPIHPSSSSSASSLPRSLSISGGENCIGIPAGFAIAEVFEHCLPGSNGLRSLKLFPIILDIANEREECCPYDGMKLIMTDVLLRLRCQPDHLIEILPKDTPREDEGLMPFIRKWQQERQKRASARRRPSKANKINTSGLSPRSLSIVSYKDELHQDGKFKMLNMGEVLKVLTDIVSSSTSWELVMFILQRLPLLLSNKHMFCGRQTFVQDHRKRMIDWICNRKFLENVLNIPRSVKKNDLSVYAYELLTVLISHRRIFTKQDQDEIVYAFYMGITQVTVATKPCINALTICCHELPLSITKMLNEILLRMSQIISVSSVSVHILEFLSGLARLPSLYANFTGDMYKPVFAIALNYLQHSHSVSQSQQFQSSGSTPGSGASPIQSPLPPGASTPGSAQQAKQEALPQYVLILAYLVITIWFTAIPLRERRKHVPFIIQRLLSANPAGKPIDEQTYTCIDMLSRFSFANISLTPEKSMVSKILMGGFDTISTASPSLAAKQNTRTWVYGHTVMTFKTAKALGWVEITIRRPSGTVSLMCNIENKMKSDEVDYKTLPALLMMQYETDITAETMIKERQGEDDVATKDMEGLGITLDTTDATSEATTLSNTSATIPANQTRQSSQSSMEKTSPRPIASASSPIMSPPQETERLLASPRTEDKNTDQIMSAVGRVLTDPDVTTPSATQLHKTEPILDPSFLFMQMQNYPDFFRMMEMTPPLTEDDATNRMMGILDRIPVVDFHKIGLLYVGRGQRTEIDILANTHGSPHYIKFLGGLGTLQRLRGRTDNTGGLDRDMDIDGKYAYFWKDDVTEMVFHVATMMPTNLERDPQCSAKKRHIGNDFVTIVYNDSGSEYAFDTLPGQFNYINIVVTPHSMCTDQTSTSDQSPAFRASWEAENNFFRVEMQRRPDMPELGPVTEPKLISAHSLPSFVRQIALHANIFAQVHSGVGSRREYVSHWRERLRQIRRIKERVATGRPDPALTATNKTTIREGYPMEAMLDFTRFT